MTGECTKTQAAETEETKSSRAGTTIINLTNKLWVNKI